MRTKILFSLQCDEWTTSWDEETKRSADTHQLTDASTDQPGKDLGLSWAGRNINPVIFLFYHYFSCDLVFIFHFPVMFRRYSAVSANNIFKIFFSVITLHSSITPLPIFFILLWFDIFHCYSIYWLLKNRYSAIIHGFDLCGWFADCFLVVHFY